jgi:predicted Zn-dependent protease
VYGTYRQHRGRLDDGKKLLTTARRLGCSRWARARHSTGHTLGATGRPLGYPLGCTVAWAARVAWAAWVAWAARVGRALGHPIGHALGVLGHPLGHPLGCLLSISVACSRDAYGHGAGTQRNPPVTL